jgi:hypothetical protein
VHGFVDALHDTADYSSTTMLETLAGVQPSLKASSNFHGSDCEAIHQTPPLPSGRIAQYCTPYSVTGRVRSSDRWPPVSSAALVLGSREPGIRVRVSRIGAIRDSSASMALAAAARGEAIRLFLPGRQAPPARPGPRRCIFRRTALRCLRTRSCRRGLQAADATPATPHGACVNVRLELSVPSGDIDAVQLQFKFAMYYIYIHRVL